MSVDILSDPQSPLNLCPNQKLLLTPTVSGGVGPYSYEWTSTEWSGSYTTPTLEITPPFNAYIQLTITDDNGCVAYASTHVKIWAMWTNVIYDNTPVCQGDTLDITLWPNYPPGTTFNWSSGQTTQNISVTNSGTYSVTVNSSGGCTITASATIFFHPEPPPVTVITGPSSLCPGQGGELTATGGPFYWYHWDGWFTSETIPITGPGTYSVTVNNGVGCAGVDTFIVESGSASPLLDGPTGLCSGQTGTISVTNASSFTGFSWSNGANTSSITVSNPGTYSVTVSAGGNCSATGSFTIDANGSNINISGNTLPVTSCTNPNGAVNVDISPPGTYNFTWSNGAITEDLANLTAGSYSVTVSGVGGCTASQVFMVSNTTTPPTATALSVSASCGQANGSVNLSVSPPGNYTYLWSNGSTAQNLTNITAGSYNATITAANGCTATTTASVSETMVNLSVSGITTPPSSGNNGSIDLTVAPVGSYTYAWSNGATTEDISGVGYGTYTVTVSAGGTCTETATFSFAPANCDMQIAFKTYFDFCTANSVWLEALPTGGTPPYTYNWGNGETTNPIEVPNLPANHFVTITDATGCTASNYAHIKTQVDGPYYPFADEGCSGNTVTLSMEWIRDSFPGTTYQWSTGETTPNIQITSSGLYVLTITDPMGCTFTTQVDFTYFPTPQPEIVGPASICPGNSATLTVTGGDFAQVYWFPQEEYVESIEVNSPGTYVVYTWFQGVSFCPGVDTLVILPGDISPPALDGPAGLCDGENGTISILNSSAYTDFNWTNGQTDDAIEVDGPGTYSVTVTNAGGCTAVGSFTVTPSSNAPQVTAIPLPATCGQANGTIDLGVSPVGAYTFLWSNGSTDEDLQNLASGTYAVTVTATGGCTATMVVGVPEEMVPIIVLGTVTPNNSCTANTGSIMLDLPAGSNYTFLWSNSATSQGLQDLPTGIYAVTVTAETGCTGSATFTIENEASQILLSIEPTSATCNQANGAANLEIEGGTAPFAILWSNGETSENISGLSPGDYSVTVTDAHGCDEALSITVNGNTSNLDLTGSATPNTSCTASNGAVDLSVSPVGAYTFLWSNGVTSEDLQDVPAGDYAVTVTDANGCTVEKSFKVMNESSLPAANVITTNATCEQSNGAVNLIVSPTGIYSFDWSNGDTSEDLGNLPAGNYAVTITNADGCTATAAAFVDNSGAAFMLAGAATPNTSCTSANGSVDVNITPAGAYTFYWSNGSTSEDLQNVASGSYSITVSAGIGCTSTANFTVPNNSSAPSLDPTATPASCSASDGAIDLEVLPAGSYTFLWSNGSTSEDLQNLTSATYAVTVTGQNGCSSITMVVVSGSATFNPTVTTTPETSCASANGNVDLSISPAGAYSYLWSNGQTSEDLQDVIAGTYTVTVTNNDGCIATASATVLNENSSFSATASIMANTSCTSANGSVDVSVSPTSAYSYLWSNGQTSEDLQNISAGTYTLTVTNADGCTATQIATVAGPTPAVISIGGPATACAGESATLTATAGFASYLWSNGSSGNSIIVSQVGSYGVTVTDVNGCTATATQLFQNNPPPTPLVNGPSSICGGEAVFSVSGGNFAQIHWSTSETTPEISVSQGGTYFVTVTDVNGCTATGSQGLLVGNSLVPNATVATTGCDGTATLDAGAGFASYLWVDGSTTATISVTASGTYFVTVSDGTGCTGTDVVTVDLPNPAQVSIIGPAGICMGSTAKFSVTGNFAQFNWNTGETTPEISVSQGGTYVVTVSDVNGCTAVASQSLTVGSSLLPDITTTLTACNGTSTLYAGGGYDSYLWSDNSTLPNLTVTANGTYSVTVSDASGCTGTSTETVTLPMPPQVQIFGATSLCEGDTTMLVVPGDFSQYLWASGETEEAINIMEGGTYVVTVSDANGCTSTAAWTVASLHASYETLQLTTCSPQDTNTVTVVWSNQFGCDSTVVTSTVLTPPIFTQINLSACAGGYATFNGTEILAGSTQEFVFNAENGCDSVVLVNVVTLPTMEIELSATKTCWNSAEGTVAVKMAGESEAPYLYSLDGGLPQSQPLFENLVGGSHTVLANDANGCSVELPVTVPQTMPLQLLISPDTLSCDEPTVRLRPLVLSGGLDSLAWTWPDGSTLPWMDVSETGTYEVQVDDGCEVQEQAIKVVWALERREADFFYIPNSFSPNGDGINDDFRVFLGLDFELLSFELQVFDRWGDSQFVTTDPSVGWEGVEREMDRQADVFVWFVKSRVRVCDGRELEVFRKGDVTVMR